MNTTLSKTCEICFKNQFKYKCPACSIRTCSLECSKLHKLQTSCTGVVDPAKYYPKKELLSSVINRDYKFLQDLDRGLVLGKRSVDEIVVKKSKKRKGNKDELLINGVRVKQLPSGMQRSLSNKSGWNNKRKKYFWTVEMVLVKEGEVNERITKEIVDSDVIEEVVRKLFKLDDQSMEIDVYLKKVECPANEPQLILLDMKKTLIGGLVGQCVVEYPTLFVIIGGKFPVGYSLEKKSESESENDSDSDSDSESDGDSESDDSDDSSESSGDDNVRNDNKSEMHEPENQEDNSDSPPEEESSRQIILPEEESSESQMQPSIE